MSSMAQDQEKQADSDFNNRRYNLTCNKCGRLANNKTWAELRDTVDKHKTKKPHHILRLNSVLGEAENDQR